MVRAAFRHGGAARMLVHHLKYRGVVAAGRMLAEAMSAHVPRGTVLVPVTRVRWRRLRYGVDPALELAREVARLADMPLVPVLAAPLWGRARAGRAHGFAPSFRIRHELGGVPVTLIDDVVTTGSTLIAAARVIPGVAGAVTATSSRVTIGVRDQTSALTSLPDGGQRLE